MWAVLTKFEWLWVTTQVTTQGSSYYTTIEWNWKNVANKLYVNVTNFEQLKLALSNCCLFFVTGSNLSNCE